MYTARNTSDWEGCWTDSKHYSKALWKVWKKKGQSGRHGHSPGIDQKACSNGADHGVKDTATKNTNAVKPVKKSTAKTENYKEAKNTLDDEPPD